MPYLTYSQLESYRVYLWTDYHKYLQTMGGGNVTEKILDSSALRKDKFVILSSYTVDELREKCPNNKFFLFYVLRYSDWIRWSTG